VYEVGTPKKRGRRKNRAEYKREEGKLRRRRRQCKARGLTQVGGRGKNGVETKGRTGNQRGEGGRV
jgi:hypothetical protein